MGFFTSYLYKYLHLKTVWLYNKERADKTNPYFVYNLQFPVLKKFREDIKNLQESFPCSRRNNLSGKVDFPRVKNSKIKVRSSSKFVEMRPLRFFKFAPHNPFVSKIPEEIRSWLGNGKFEWICAPEN